MDTSHTCKLCLVSFSVSHGLCVLIPLHAKITVLKRLILIDRLIGEPKWQIIRFCVFYFKTSNGIKITI